MENTRPFLKWVGGKYRLRHEILKRLPEGSLLIEPFVGAGAVFLNAQYPRYWINDINPVLIDLYRTLKQEGVSFIEEMRRYFVPQNNTKERYLMFRDTFNQTQCRHTRAALFLFLNRHGYNGLCRFNRSGGYNVPFGAHTKPYFPETELKIFCEKMASCKLTRWSFEKVMAQAPAGSVVYCDPPYWSGQAQRTCFSQYAPEHFGWEKQEHLAECARHAASRGVCVMISNHDVAAVRRLYQGAAFGTVRVTRPVAANPQKRGAVKELIALFAADQFV